MKDTIYRQDAIDTFLTDGSVFAYGEDVCKAVISRLKELPSVESKIVYCKDCVKHGKRFDEYPASEACPLTVWRVAQGHEFDYQFCVYAERRTDEGD